MERRADSYVTPTLAGAAVPTGGRRLVVVETDQPLVEGERRGPSGLACGGLHVGCRKLARFHVPFCRVNSDDVIDVVRARRQRMDNDRRL